MTRFSLGAERSGHYLIASRMVPYKRVELVVEAFRRMPDRRLVVTGDGPSEALVRAAAAGASNIEFRGRVPQAELVVLTQSARAVLAAAEEDFGIAMVEAQACGTPLIAFGRGGARDIVQTGSTPTGILFEPQSAAAIIAAVGQFEAMAIDPAACRANALRFSEAAFRERMRTHVEALLP
ncbi:glycosyltransferase [Paeniroseomonas aquatica]|uniref:glycosyltransferase n=1 Tax=Paeniroseomonas aquatica TaxID=373043 RepID=UPI0036080F7A